MRAGQVVGKVTGNARLTKERGQLMGARLRWPLKFAEYDPSMRRVVDDAWFDTIEADEAETAQDLCRRKQSGQFFLVAQAVLERDDRRVRADERREHFRELVVGGGL